MLTVDTVPDYLLATGRITSRAILDGDLDVVSLTRRNANLQVTTRGGGGFLLKQPTGGEPAARATLATEARFYAYLQTAPALAAARRALPQIAFHDPERELFAVEFLDGTLPLWRFYREQTADRFPVEVTRQVGDLLGLLHGAFAGLAADEIPGFLIGELPWALNLDRPTPEKLSRMSAAQFDLIRLVQAEAGTVERLGELRARWRPTAIVHGDVKMDNFLVGRPDGPRAGALFLIDWELVQLGDPAWDLAGALQDFVFWWVLSMPHDRPPEEMAAHAGFPLPVLQNGLRALWEGYRLRRGLGAAAADELLAAAVAYSGARILQTAAEIAGKYQSLPAPAVLMSQIGVNLLADPAAARDQLYGLAEPGTEDGTL
jgi:aminoglycoside phosphotransferase (APT) family kinase protein